MISFQNEGLIDKRAITIMGISSKEGENPIGYFGTGLKYAISIILRSGGRITIWIGEERLEFSTRRETVRVDEFDIIYMNDQQLGFTTRLGRNWETWMAFRELYCNTVDESGVCSPSNLPPREGCTTIHVSGVPEFEECYAKRSSFILTTRPVWQGSRVEIHPGKSNHVYYRGILAAELEHTAEQTYNMVARMDLTEDRTLRNPSLVRHYLVADIMQCHDPEIIERFVAAPIDSYENKLLFESHYCSEPDEVFMQVMEELTRDYSRPLNFHAERIYRQRQQRLAEPETVELTKTQRVQVRRAVEFCRAMGYEVDKNPIFFVRHMPGGRLATAETDTKRIIISEKVLEIGTKYLASTLLEEHLHLEHQFVDCSRDFQNFLMDKVVTLMEEIRGEPL